MKVLITGGMGVIGAETSRKFVREGHRPVIFARHRDDSLIPDIIEITPRPRLSAGFCEGRNVCASSIT